MTYWSSIVQVNIICITCIICLVIRRDLEPEIHNVSACRAQTQVLYVPACARKDFNSGQAARLELAMQMQSVVFTLQFGA